MALARDKLAALLRLLRDLLRNFCSLPPACLRDVCYLFVWDLLSDLLRDPNYCEPIACMTCCAFD